MVELGREEVRVIKAKADFSKLSNAINREYKKAATNKKYQISCKNCRAKVVVPVGKSVCPACGKEINLILNFH